MVCSINIHFSNTHLLNRAGTIPFALVLLTGSLLMTTLVADDVVAEEVVANEQAADQSIVEKEDSTSQPVMAKEDTDNDAASELLSAIIARNTALKNSLDLTIENHRAAIEQKENEVGPYDLELSEMVYGLGKTLQTSQRYGEAINAYRRSLYLKRVNDGVYSLSQAPMLRGIIESHVRQGQTDAAAESYEQLVWIHLKTYGNNDPRLISLFEEVGQWHLNAYIQTEQREDGYHLNAAFDLYSIAIKLSSEHHGDSNIELIDLLKNLAITSYYQTLHQQRYPEFAELGAGVPFGYRPLGTTGDELLRRGSYYLHGHAAHRRILHILNSNQEVTSIDKAKAHTDLGDWFLLYGRQQLAITAYQQAHKAMEDDEQKDEVLASLFGMPTMLPKLETKIVQETTIISDALLTRSSAPSKQLSENSSENSKDSGNTKNTPYQNLFIHDSYVNLTVDVTEKGAPTNLKISEVYPEGADSYGSRARQTIRAKKFRPRFESGSPVLTNAFPIKVLIPNENS